MIHYDADQQRAMLEPEFYIDTGRYFNEAADITDTYAFGKDIPAYATGSNQELDARITALSYIMTGLFDYMTLKYDEALDRLRRCARRLRLEHGGRQGDRLRAARATPT